MWNMKKYNLINNSLGWLCFAVATVTYLLTMEPTASFWDCPEFISQGAKLEVGHPPGNPIFMLTARFFVTIFGGGMDTAAIAVNSMSALLSAFTILLLFWTITHLVRRIVVSDDSTDISLSKLIVIMGAGICGALVYTWSDTFWFSAVEGEVYAFSSLCTALVFWLILKWENHADEPHSDRYLVLIAYVIGVSIAVHLLNLLCIPAIGLVFYYRKYKNANVKGSLLALLISVVVVGAILYGLVPGFIKVAQGFELFFVNSVGLGYNMGVLIYAFVLLAVFAATIFAFNGNRKFSSSVVKLLFMLCIMISGLTFLTSSALIWVLSIAALAIYLWGFCKNIPVRVFNLITISIFVIFIGYSSYALLLIRASANTPMNQNAPDNVFALSSYLNREQYGQRPLFNGPVFAEALDVQQAYDDQQNVVSYVAVDEKGMPVTKVIDGIMRDANGAAIDNGSSGYTKVSKNSPDEPDRYVEALWTPDYKITPDLNMLFTRVYSSDPEHVKGYKGWCLYRNEDLEMLPYTAGKDRMNQWANQGYAPMIELGSFLHNMTPISTYEGSMGPDQYVWKASFADNFRYFMNYQLNHMYWRYFMWNFAGRQNDIQGNGEPHLGNWISGIPFIDNMRLGDQSLVPEEFTTGNKGHNVFYMLPLLLGVFGIIWQSLCRHRGASDEKRGIEQFWVVFFLFFMTGIAIILYLNQTPGQPRERDYAFAGSFYAFAIWVGMGVPAIWQWICNIADGKKKASMGDPDASRATVPAAAVAAIIGILVPLQMVSQTWDDHDRSGRYTTRDFGENYLNSLDRNAIIFTNGDNDTFPLWYAQEVEGVRTDVRVINLSYLSTDWYANQLLHPYYDAQAVKMTAKPTDYAYEKLVWSFTDPRASQEPVEAMQGLAQFYASEPDTEMTNRPIHLLSTPRMYSAVDTAAAYRAFNIDPESADSTYRIPYLSDITMNGLASSFGLSKLLSFDIVANSVADGFERPVYFATTVPNRYYLGLEPYLSNTGLAQQVTPFRSAPVSPTVEKAFENIVSRFRWGGLDNPDAKNSLYLDETVRRMVSTVRNSIIETAEHLINSGDLPASKFAVEWAKANGKPVPANRYDMARILLNMMEEKLPADVARYESMTDIPTIILYLKLNAVSGNSDDMARASNLIDISMKRYAQLSRYAASLDATRLHALGNSETYALRYVPLLIGLQNYIDLRDNLSTDPAANAQALKDLAETLSIDNGSYVYHWLYLENMSTEELEQNAADLAAYPAWNELMQRALTLSAIHDSTSTDRMSRTRRLLDDYSLTIKDLTRLNPTY